MARRGTGKMTEVASDSKHERKLMMSRILWLSWETHHE